MKTISIIIPTLNEAGNIWKTITAIYERALIKPHEIIVVDAGSRDETLSLLSKLNTKSFEMPAFQGKKYESLNFGASKASGDILFFMDADCIVPHHFDKIIYQCLLSDKIVAGAFEFAFDKTTWLLVVATWLNRARYRITKRYYGDQGLFMTNETFMQSGGYPSSKLMESAHFCRKLKGHGNLKLVKEKMTTSSRRFIQGGTMRVFLKDVWIWLLDIIGFDIQRYAERYWKSNMDNS